MAATLFEQFEQEVALLDTVFSEAPVGLAFFDTDLRYVRVNDTLAEMNGIAPSDHIGRTLLEVLPEMDPAVVEGFRRALATGAPMKDVEVVGRTPSRPGMDRTWLCGWYPVRQRSGGQILGLGAIVVEVTERVRAERRAEYLAKVGDVLSESLDWEETLRRVAEVAVPDKADLCVVHLAAESGRVQRLALVHADPAKERIATELQTRWPASTAAPEGTGRVLRSGVPSFTPEVTDLMLQAHARDDDALRLLRELDITSQVIVPLVARGRTLGTMTFAMSGSGRRFGADDVELASEVARRAAAAVDNARLYGERDHIAQTLQRSLLPPRLPDIEGFEIAARYRAAGEAYEVGGDFYDVFQVAGGGWSVVVGDVCGKGPEAAALTALARYTLRAGALVEPAPARALAMLNDVVLSEHDDFRFLTAVAGHLEGHRLDLALAAQPAAIVVRASGPVELVGDPGRLVGIRPGLVLEQATVELERGDAVVLHTDGLTDAGAPARVLESAEIGAVAAEALSDGAAAVAAALEARALEVADGAPRDDIALMVLRRED